MNELDEFNYINSLYEIYKKALTTKQVLIMDKYYLFNLSLSEISDELNISRNAVSDTLKHVKEKLINYENEFHLYFKINKLIEKINKLDIPEESKKELIEVLYYGI